jgi:ABC-type antimicrobial peptide transport system permease subunit
MSIFGVIAIAIGAVGVYGTMAFFVAAEVRAIGLRMALGASPGRVMRGVLRDAGWRVAAGIVIGLGVAWAVSGAFASLVFGVTTTSPAVYAGVAAAIGVVGGLAALVPALRAARLDPLVALRTE